MVSNVEGVLECFKFYSDNIATRIHISLLYYKFIIRFARSSFADKVGSLQVSSTDLKTQSDKNLFCMNEPHVALHILCLDSEPLYSVYRNMR